MNKNCIIIHGCPDDSNDKTYNKHWIPWIKKQLENNSIRVSVPLMPAPWNPNYVEFKKKLEKYNINKETILIGHSCGCAFLVRWLGESKQRINKLILIAPWKIALTKKKKAFYEYQIDESIKNRVNKIIMFTSDDEEDDGKKSLEIYNKVLGGEIIELKSHGHYTLRDMGTEEFPELLKKILKDPL
jgi:predicted alpha/beta hydrolase family esterase